MTVVRDWIAVPTFTIIMLVRVDITKQAWLAFASAKRAKEKRNERSQCGSYMTTRKTQDERGVCCTYTHDSPA